MSGNTSRATHGHGLPGKAAGSALGKETGWLIGKANGPGLGELQLTHKGMLCTVSSLPAVQLDGSPENLTLTQGTRAGKATSCLRGGSGTGCYVRGCALLSRQPEPEEQGSATPAFSDVWVSSAHSNTGTRIAKSPLCTPSRRSLRTRVPTVLENDLSCLCSPRFVLSGMG